MLTAEGATFILELLSGETADLLQGGSIAVSDGGDQRASSEIESLRVEDGVLIATARFDEGFANFDWRRRELLTRQGKVIDQLDEDLGRKAAGAVWMIAVEVELGSGA